MVFSGSLACKRTWAYDRSCQIRPQEMVPSRWILPASLTACPEIHVVRGQGSCRAVRPLEKKRLSGSFALPALSFLAKFETRSSVSGCSSVRQTVTVSSNGH